MASNIFISYAREDMGVAETVCSNLEQEGIPCWIAPRDVLPGAEYADAIIGALNNCKVFLLVFSKSSNDSPQVTREVERAVSKNLIILTLRVDNAVLSNAMEYYLSNHHWMDISSGSLTKELGSLVKTVSKLLKRAPQPGKEPAASKSKETVIPNTTANPFGFGNPITDPTLFYGRKAEIRQIVNRLLSSAHESTSVVGERRIGKTSLLKHLSNPDVAAGLGLAKTKFCLVFVDFEGLTDITPHRFWQRVLTKISHSICDPSLVDPVIKLSQQSSFDLFDLEDCFEQITSKDVVIVLFMDEFEYVTQNPNFGSDFFGGLRSLAIHKGFALIPATRRELVELCHSNELKGSPFFNIFSSVVLRPFGHDEVHELTAGYLKGKDMAFSPHEMDMVYGFGGGYPFFIQMACYFLYDGKTQGLSGDVLEKYVNDNFRAQAEGHYTYLWGHCSESERVTLLILLLLAQQKERETSCPTTGELSKLRARSSLDISSLQKHGVLMETSSRISIFSTSFTHWIHDEVFATTGEEEPKNSIDSWMKSKGIQSNSESAKSILPLFKKKYWENLDEITEHFTRSLDLLE